jgi:DNA-binding transcriptional ArsR family regulator
MRVTEVFRLTDERALVALAHPLRWRLLALLRADGPATATRLAERVQESSGLTSYHLRKLAEFGLVEEDQERGTRRERWWRAVHELTSWSPADFLGNPAARQASVAWRREVYRSQWRLIEQWLAEESDWDKAWVDAASPDDSLLEMTPESLRAMTDEIWAVVERYRQNPPVDRSDTARVIWFQHKIPVREVSL